MKHAHSLSLFVHAAPLILALVSLAPPASNAAAFKCKAADGKIEYSDRPCEVTKSTIAGPQGAKIDGQKSGPDPISELQKIFDEFEPTLCERERLAGEIDRATRNGELHSKPAAWAPKQEKLYNLNDQMAIFQERVGKYTRPAGVNSREIAAVRKFQMGLKNCDRPLPGKILPTKGQASTPPANVATTPPTKK
jgi:hypothetical protein